MPRINRIIRKSVDAILFTDNYIPTDAKYLIDMNNERRFKIADCSHVQDGIAPALYSDDNLQTELYPSHAVMRTRVTIERVTSTTLNSGIDQVDVLHDFTYEA